MNHAAREVLTQIPDIFLAYGQSDEFSFMLHPACNLYERRSSKLVSTIVSIFSTAYAMFWSRYFTETSLTPPFPSFDGRAVMYPTLHSMRDYLRWRQVDCHINNLYNTTFWTLVNEGGLTNREAEEELKGTFAKDKNEILFQRFGINYNEENAIYRKGSVIFGDYGSDRSNGKARSRIETAHVDIMKDDFWTAHPWLLEHGSARKRAVKKFLEDHPKTGADDLDEHGGNDDDGTVDVG